MDDLISRHAAIDCEYQVKIINDIEYVMLSEVQMKMRKLPSAQPEIIRCKDCQWWDRRADDSPMGYCHACKHGHYSRHWEISIIRTYEENFFCADAERRTDE